MVEKYGSTVAIVVIVVIVVALLVLIKAIYMRFLQSKVQFNGKMLWFGRLIKFISGYSPLVKVYRDFLSTLPFSQRMNIKRKDKFIILDYDINAKDNFGIEFKYHNQQIYCAIHPGHFSESEFTRHDITHFFGRFLRGKLNLVIININLIRDMSSFYLSHADAINDVFKCIASYMSDQVNYCINIKNARTSVGYKQWINYRSQRRLPDFFQQMQPDQKWIDEIIGDRAHYELELCDNPATTDDIRDLYNFLNNCAKSGQFLEMTQSALKSQHYHYIGFGIGLIDENKFRSSKLNVAYKKYKFGYKVRNYILGILLMGVSGGLVAGFIGLRENIDSNIDQMIYKQGNQISGQSFNQYSFERSTAQTDKQFTTVLSRYIYPDVSINYINKERWADKFLNDILLPELKLTKNPIKAYIIGLLIHDSQNPVVIQSINQDIWLWSRATGMSEENIRLWLEVGSTLHSAEIPKVGHRNKYQPLVTKAELIATADDIISDVSYKYRTSQSFLKQDVVADSVEVTLINKLERSFAEAQKDHEINYKIHQLLTEHKYMLSKAELKNMEKLIDVMRIGESIREISDAKNVQGILSIMNRLVVDSSISSDVEWNTFLTNRLIQFITSKVKEINNQPLIGKIPKNVYYSREFYHAEVHPLYSEMNSVLESYKRKGYRIKYLHDLFNQTFYEYGSKYQAYYVNNVKKALSYHSDSNEAFINNLSYIGESSALSSALIAIKCNIFGLGEDKIDGFMKGLTYKFRGLDKFTAKQSEYYELLSIYAQVLRSSSSKPQKLVKYYALKNQSFVSLMGSLLKPYGLSPGFNSMFMAPAKHAETIGDGIVKHYAQKYWTDEISPIFNLVFNYYPFNHQSQDIILPIDLKGLVGPDGEFWAKFNLVISGLINNFPDKRWLTQSQYHDYQMIKSIRDSFWTADGDKKPLQFNMVTTGQMPTLTYINDPWYWFSSEKIKGYVGVLSSGSNKIMSIGASNISHPFYIKWWEPSVTSVTLISENGDILSEKTNSGLWSFWIMLDQSGEENQNHYWTFNRGKTRISFDIQAQSLIEQIWV